MEREVREAHARLVAVAEDTDNYLEKLVAGAERVAGRTSAVLFGGLGGTLGTVFAVVTSHLTGVPLLTLGAASTAAGLFLGVIAFRGSRRFQLEKRIEENRIAADEILDRIKSLPDGAPDEVEEDLWHSYRLLTAGYDSNTHRLIEVGRTAEQEALVTNLLRLKEPTVEESGRREI